jgi:hypothetical protein
MTRQDPISYDDIYPERPDEGRSIAHRLAAILRRHRADPKDPESTCTCGYVGSYLGHVTRSTLLELKDEGLEVRASRFI